MMTGYFKIGNVSVSYLTLDFLRGKFVSLPYLGIIGYIPLSKGPWHLTFLLVHIINSSSSSSNFCPNYVMVSYRNYVSSFPYILNGMSISQNFVSACIAFKRSGRLIRWLPSLKCAHLGTSQSPLSQWSTLCQVGLRSKVRCSKSCRWFVAENHSALHMSSIHSANFQTIRLKNFLYVIAPHCMILAPLICTTSSLLSKETCSMGFILDYCFKVNSRKARNYRSELFFPTEKVLHCIWC